MLDKLAVPNGKLAVPKLSLDDVKNNVIRKKEVCVAKKDMDVKTEAIKKKNELTEKLNSGAANMKENIDGFTTISLMQQHPSVYAHTNMDKHQSNEQDKHILPMNQFILFSPHLENASIMKLLIMVVMVLSLTQLFITYRSMIYHFIDKLHSNPLVKTTFKYVF